MTLDEMVERVALFNVIDEFRDAHIEAGDGNESVYTFRRGPQLREALAKARAELARTYNNRSAQVAERPTDNNADAWHVWLEEHGDSSNAYKAVQIATALDISEERSRLLDRMQAPRVIFTSEDHGVCVGGRFDGWLMWKHPDGQWVTVRKLVQERLQKEGDRG